MIIATIKTHNKELTLPQTTTTKEKSTYMQNENQIKPKKQIGGKCIVLISTQV
jgi:hypothetical protein